MSEEIRTAWQSIITAGLLGGIVGSLLTVIFNHRLTLWREKRSSINADIRKMIPLIEGYILGASKGEMLGSIRYDAQEELFQPAMSFRIHLKGKALIKFNDAWDKFHQTTREEVGNAQPNTAIEDNEKAKQILLFRLKQLLKAVQES